MYQLCDLGTFISLRLDFLICKMGTPTSITMMAVNNGHAKDNRSSAEVTGYHQPAYYLPIGLLGDSHQHARR